MSTNDDVDNTIPDHFLFEARTRRLPGAPDLPADRRQHGFGGFRYGEHAVLDFGSQCVMEQPLPDYPVARILTGQFTPKAEFPVGAVEGEQGR